LCEEKGKCYRAHPQHEPSSQIFCADGNCAIGAINIRFNHHSRYDENLNLELHASVWLSRCWDRKKLATAAVTQEPNICVHPAPFTSFNFDEFIGVSAFCCSFSLPLHFCAFACHSLTTLCLLSETAIAFTNETKAHRKDPSGMEGEEKKNINFTIKMRHILQMLLSYVKCSRQSSERRITWTSIC
jgi:hypothetical protein